MPSAQRHLAVGAGADAEGDAAGAAAEVDAGERRVVGVVDGDVVVALVGEDPQLRRQVGLEVAVAVEVVGREVEEDRALGGEGGAVLELEAGALADDGRVGLDRADAAPASGVPTLPATATGSPAVAVDVAEQLGRGRLAVGAGDGEEAVRERAPGQLELAGHLDAALAGPPRSPAPPGARRGS